MDIKKSLIKYLEKNPPKDTDSIDEDELFLHEYAAVHLEPPKGIPTFYYPSGLPEHPLACRLREEARAKILKRKENELINNTELKNLWTLLDSHASSTKENDDKYLTYHDYKRVRKESDPKVQSFLSSRLYLTLAEESSGRLLVATLFDYIMRKTWLLQTRIELSLYDKDGSGFLEETDLETYLGELIHTLPKLDILEKSFHPFYICTAIRDILASGFLDDFLELRDQEAGKDLQESQYLNLDNDHNGMLSPSELKNYGTGTLTDTFIQRVFQECLTYDSEMDYKTYIDFVLAFENRKSPQSLRYFFHILKEMDKLKQEPVRFEDVMDEIFDMISPKDPNRITLQDLVNSKQGNTIISILIDLNGFWCHESREDYITEEDEDLPKLQIKCFLSQILGRFLCFGHFIFICSLHH
ncbi:PPP2R3 [Lepeophtheirus salmonis]|uniref:PPP2R3 n=1 Tax=Lepeophtheirus salmonis TaxID=72036 RepID=A0A7R8D481_LEPSM|nr:PPP2R3 [Lepeophtheirus salmonis]CAF3023694.1 PPP2R3 [Lepeophtheirus salmonis]